MLIGDIVKLTIIGLLGRVKNNANIHHDVDEQAILRYERAQILTFLLKPQRQSFASLDNDFVHSFITCQVIPALVGGVEQKSEVMDISIGFAVFDQSRIMLSFLAPFFVFILFINQPQLTT